MYVFRQCGVGGDTAGKAAVDRAPGSRRKTCGSHGPGTGPLVPGGLFHLWLPGLVRGPLPVVDSLNLPQLRGVTIRQKKKAVMITTWRQLMVVIHGMVLG